MRRYFTGAYPARRGPMQKGLTLILEICQKYTSIFLNEHMDFRNIAFIVHFNNFIPKSS